MSSVVSAQKKPYRGRMVMIVLLWLAIIVSSLAVIFSSYQTRIKVNELAGLREEQDQLHVVWSQYLLEESAWASYGRIEKIAVEKLSMQVPTTEQIIMVRVNEE